MKISWLVLLSILVINCSDPTESGYEISGNLEGLEDGQAFLVKLNLEDNSTQYIDTAIISKGKFSFSGRVDSPYPYTIYLNSKEEKIHLFLDNSQIVLDGLSNGLEKIKVSGSREDSLFRPWFNNTLFEFDADLDIIFNHSDYNLAPFVAFYHVQTYPTSMDSLNLMLFQFEGDIKQSSYYTAFKELVEQSAKVAIGERAPEFSLPDTLGNKLSLKEVDAKLILIDFWASWCKPCRAANPTLVKLYADYRSKGLEIISISVDDNRSKWVKAIKKDQLVWPQLSEVKGWNTEVTNDYAIKAVPQNFLLDATGKILAKNIEIENLEKVIERTLASN